MVEEAGGVAVFQKAAVVEEGDVVAGVAGEAHLVGDDDAARAGFGEVAHDVEHFLSLIHISILLNCHSDNFVRLAGKQLDAR